MIDTLTKVIAALEFAGVELIGENSVSHVGGRGVRLREPASPLVHTPNMSAGKTGADGLPA
jgi:hypothetical protein